MKKDREPQKATISLTIFLDQVLEKDEPPTPPVSVWEMRKELVRQVLDTRRCPHCHCSFIPNDKTAESARAMLKKFL